MTTWKEKYGTPKKTTRQYSKPSQCTNFWAWLGYSWNYVTADGYREIGSRLFGFSVRRYYAIPQGELRF